MIEINKEVNIVYPFIETFLDYPDNSSHAIILYFIGCHHGCQGCHSKCKDVNNFEQRQYKTFNSVKFLYNHLIVASRKFKTNKVVLSGGQPLIHINFVKQLLQHNKYFDICIYTGFSEQFIYHLKQRGLKGFQYIKFGRFMEEMYQIPEKRDQYMKLASKNQNFYDKDFNKISENGILKFRRQT